MESEQGNVAMGYIAATVWRHINADVQRNQSMIWETVPRSQTRTAR